ncbi:Dyp-type peroxidase [Actinomadura harenae]|uniref:Dyp-type peroxidase n=1 Tax=Actinomadura harenae TaxID=2483351 RepID=A0A3M2MAA5_9ACTN|nr:Dyp-type peroxidase [Actinomadura harenae]RMI46537.1 Dyp-type peroxidase [Actinomadura harenae]
MTDRRSFLRGAFAAGVGGVATASVSGAAASVSGAAASEAGDAERPLRGFHGVHQAGVEEAPLPRTSVVAFDVIAENRRELADLMRAITDRARVLTAGGVPDGAGITAPPADSGVLGPDVPGGRLLVTAGVGASLFDGRFGLASRRPAGLTTMPTFPNDALDPAWCHGDLSLQLSARDEDTVVHALRDIARHTRGAAQIRWRMDGFVSPPRPSGTPRNLLGFRDGTANPAPADLGRLVWNADGGTFLVVRLIRMLVEFWDRVGITEQEQIIGRARDTGAPLDGDGEFDPPRFAADPIGKIIPLTSHIRLANPRTAQTEGSRILRRGFNYDRGVDAVGDLDMGLVFTCYQRDIASQFEAVQHRLKDEPLVDYVRPFGGGYFLVLPGARDDRDFLGRALLA